MPVTPKGRVCFAEVYHPTAMNETAKKKYSLILLINPEEVKKDPEQQQKLDALVAAVEACCRETFKCGMKDLYKGKALTSPFRRSEEKPDYMPPGHIFFKLSTVKKPDVVDGLKNDIPEDSNNFYSGCIAHCSYNCFAYDEGGNRGVSIGLNNVQKVADGEPMGGVKTSAQDDFDELPVGSSIGDEIPF